MKKLIVFSALALFIGVIATPVFASTETNRIVMAKYDDDPKKNKDKKENTEKKETKEATDTKENKDCKKECQQTCKPSNCEDHNKTEEKK